MTKKKGKGNYKRATPEEAKRRLAVLRRMQKMPLKEKISITREVIKAAFDARAKGAVLYSGGKDSTIILDLVLQADPNTLVVHNNTTLGDPKLLDFIREHCRNMNYIETITPNPEDMWKEKGYYPLLGKRNFTKYKKQDPTLRISPVQCCYQLKEKLANVVLKQNKVGVVFWGIRADESMRRRFLFVDNGFLFQPKKYKWMQCYPLQHWTEKDVFEYLEKYVPEYNLRREQFETGCLCCGSDITFFPNNLTRLYQADQKKWEHYMRAGFAEQILKLQGRPSDPETIEKVLTEAPATLLKV